MMAETVEKLLQEVLTIRQERDLVRERLERLQVQRGDVSPSVYERVEREYRVRLEEMETRLQEAQHPLDEEKTRLDGERQRIAAELSSCNEHREEIILRHKIGELNDGEFRDRTAPLDAQRETLAKELAGTEAALLRLSQNQTAASPPADDDFQSPLPPVDDFVPEGPPPPQGDDATDPRLDGTPSPPPATPGVQQAALVCYDEGKLLEKWLLEEATRIGRAPGNHIVLKEPKVSRHHATVEQQNGHYLLKDLGSSNGTFVNGEKISEQILQPGDEVMIGDFKLTFEIP